MHSAKFMVALAAGALAIPFEKRAAVTQTTVDVVYVTDVVTVTAGGAPAAAKQASTVHHHHHTTHKAAAAATPSTEQGNYPSGGWSSWNWGGWGSSEYNPPAPATTVVTVQPSKQTYSPQPSQYQSPSQASNSPAPSKASPTAASGAAPTGYSEIAVFAHNLHRANHSAPNIEWDDSLAASAQTIAETCIYEHNTQVAGGGYGQNIAAGVAADNISAVITDLFYNGEVNYYAGYYGEAQPPMTNFDSWGHFSQIVWKASTHLGCYTADCSSQGLANTGGDVEPYFTVCNYASPGNFANEYGANIGEPLGHPTAQWNTGL